MAGLQREARLRAYVPAMTSSCVGVLKTWMPGTTARA
jgi:hypothetical protein